VCPPRSGGLRKSSERINIGDDVLRKSKFIIYPLKF
jgi:hypothetical protein